MLLFEFMNSTFDFYAFGDGYYKNVINAFLIPTIKCAYNLHPKRANWALNMVLMLLTKFVPNSTIRRCRSEIFQFN